MKRNMLLLLIIISLFSFTYKQSRIRTRVIGQAIDFDENWRFLKGNPVGASSVNFDDSKWQVVQLPHDRAITGPVEIEGDANTGKLPWRGEGWYRKSFIIGREDKGERVYFIFYGIMAFPVIYINGHKAGSWDYGYNSFYIDATEWIKFGEKNVIAIYVDTRKHQSRWYPGAGIYRKVEMYILDEIHLQPWGIVVTTSEVGKNKAIVKVKSLVVNQGNTERRVTIETSLISPEGQEIAQKKESLPVAPDTEVEFNQTFEVSHPQRWDINSPKLYKVRTVLKKEGVLCDMRNTEFGIRTFKFTTDDGFHLNGRRVQIKGVNLHHDQGPLGAAFYPRAMERQLEILRNMGVNAIRTSHNMPAPELLTFCDKMGFIVYNEAFDKWTERWRGTADLLPDTDFKEFMNRQIKNFVERDRNHPSVVLWSVGNEMYDIEMNKEKGAFEKLKMVIQLFHKYDPTRPVTLTCFMQKSIKFGHSALYDVQSWNYGGKYIYAYQADSTKPVLCSESSSAISTRDYYEFPLVKNKTYFSDSLQISSYDLHAVEWGDIPDWEFYRLEENPYACGEFVWSGFDYIGEPTPYNNYYVRKGKITKAQASRSSYFGIIDLCGIPKDRYYLYRSYWAPEKTTVHILPHWTWPGREGKIIPVYVYTNGDSAELFVNGKSYGVKAKKRDETVSLLEKYEKDYYCILDRYRLRWENVIYEPGEVRVKAYKSGHLLATAVRKTVGTPAEIRLTPDRSKIHADGYDLSYILVEAVDKYGVVNPHTNSIVKFLVGGPAVIAGVGNGNPQSKTPFVSNKCPLFHGKAMLIIRSLRNKKGTINVTAVCKKLTSGYTEIISY